MKKVLNVIVLCLISFKTLASPNLLNEYNKEIDPFYKQLKYISTVMNGLAEKELRGESITEKEQKKVFFLNCSSLGYMNKIKFISDKPKYKNLEKAKRLKNMIFKTKEVMEVTDKECTQAGIYVPLK